MRVVVVGATGNVGTAVLERLHGEPDVLKLEGVARHLPDDSVWPYSGVGWHSIDVGADDAVERLTDVFRGADAVICLAWLLQPSRHEQAIRRVNVDGTMNVARAAAAAGVPQFLYASSVGAYSRGPKNRRVLETWATDGIPTSPYSRQKADVERRLDAFEAEHPDLVVTRLRPGLVMQGAAAQEIRRLFVGPLLPIGAVLRIGLPVVPLPRSTISQVVAASDLADAFWKAIDRRARGAFNIAGEPVLTPQRIAHLLDARWIRVRAQALRALVSVSWHLRLVAADPGWLDLATQVPVMSTSRARDELGWIPQVGALHALSEVIDGLKTKQGKHGSFSLRP
jgi:UDP-glucose 4-epimerase